MRTVAYLAFALAILCAPVLAEGTWKFEQGSTYTWQGTTEFHYEQGEAPPAGGGSGGPPVPTTFSDPQWETVTLEATVQSVDPDGTGHLEFVVKAVHIETRFDSGGEHAEWDSSKSEETDVEGYKRYQAILGNRFKAIVGPDGSVRGLEGAEWARPDAPAEAKKVKGSVGRVEKAARLTHDPTHPSVWMSLIFGTTPERRETWTRELALSQQEKLSWRTDGEETIGSWRCSRAKLESKDKKRLVKAKDVKTQEGRSEDEVGQFALSLCDAARKRGTVWFSRKIGCLVKTEVEAATEYSDGARLTNTYFRWNVELKSRGTAETVPVDPGTTPSK